MAQRKIQLVNGEFYHIVVRVLDSLPLFREKADYLRMIHDIFEFNDLNNTTSKFRVALHRKQNTTRNVTKPGNVTLDREPRKLLVNVHAFCLMPNHVHLLLEQLVEGGISRFVQKLGGYSRFYNKKYDRKGYLFQDRFRAVHVRNNEQLKTVFVYIHTNPVALVYPKWKEKGIGDAKRASAYIEDYRWSSYPDYLGKKNFPSLTNREFLTKVMGETKRTKELVNGWLIHKQELKDFDYVAIE